MGRWGPWLAAVLSGALLWTAAVRRPGPGSVLVALDASQVRVLCEASGYPLSDFWERARAMGVAAAFFQEETLGDLADRGEVLSLSPQEIEKWKTFGLVASAAALKPNALWVKDQRLLQRLLGAAERAGVTASTAAMAGYHVAEFPGGLKASFPAGYDEASVALAESAKLAPLLGNWEFGGRAWSKRVLSVTAPPSALLRAVYSHPRRAVLFTLEPGLGLEENFSRLRALLKLLRARGIVLHSLRPDAIPEGPQDAAASEAQPLRRDVTSEGSQDAATSAAAWRLWLGWVLSVAAPLLAMRAGLQAFKKARLAVLERWPLASPVLEIGAGFLSIAAVAVGGGLAVSSILGPAAPAGFSENLAWAGLAVPLFIGALALYPVESGYWKKRFSSALTVGGAARGVLAALLVLLLLKPRLVLSAAGLWPWAERLGEACQWLWWWRWRWREILVGFPALLYAFVLLERRLACPDCPQGQKGRPPEDPRGWLLLGLIGPSGVVTAVGYPGSPLGMVLSQTAAVVAFGGLIGAGWSLLRRPRRPRTP